ncbi:MAG: hypothetical protein J6Q35_06425 [Rikenellaceae bacterium]|nr:hypothetical protein [Rikenellaceae bacterium]
MTGKVCKKCGVAIFDASSEFCDVCKPPTKETLFIKEPASIKLLKVNNILKYVAVITLLVGVKFSIFGLFGLYEWIDESYSEVFDLGIGFILYGVLIFIVRVFVKSAITITKSAEYYNAQITEKFLIKYK